MRRPVQSVLAVALSLAAGPAFAAGAPESGTAFPSYSREDVAVCLDEYGVGSTSPIDCVARDDATKASLQRRWAEIDDGKRKGCVARLAGMRHGSYSHLESCIRQARQDAATAD